MIESVTLRMDGHAVHDDASYVPREMFEELGPRDPIERFRTWLRDNASMTLAEEDEISVGVKKLLNDSLARAEESPLPDPATLLYGVYATRDELETPTTSRWQRRPTSRRSATGSGRRCASTSACSCSARTSAFTAAPSR